MFKGQQNESPYDRIVTVTETVFSNGRLLKIFVKICNIEFHENSIAFYRRCPVTDGPNAGCFLHVTLSLCLKESNNHVLNYLGATSGVVLRCGFSYLIVTIYALGRIIKLPPACMISFRFTIYQCTKCSTTGV